MNRQAIGTNCGIYCWSVGVVSGVLAFVVLWGLLGAAPLVALVLGAVLAAGAGFFLVWAFCAPLLDSQGEAIETSAAPVAQPPAPERPVAAAQPVAPPAPPPAAPEPAPESVAEPAPEPAVAAVGAPPAGVRLMARPDGEADDLKRIKGIGPKLEQKLNSMGIWHFSQIARWAEDDVAWVDATLNFRGRIVRDDWIAQARVLSEGGETEFSRRADAT